MKNFTSLFLKARLVFVALVVAAMLLPVSTQTASAQSTDSCYTLMSTSYPLYLFEDNFEGCAMTIQASGYAAEFSFGYWGNYPVAVHLYGNAFYMDVDGQWYYYGVVDTGLISKCIQGNNSACATFHRQADLVIQHLAMLNQ